MPYAISAIDHRWNVLAQFPQFTANLLKLCRVRTRCINPHCRETASRTHAPLTIGAESLGYDVNGNMTGDGSRVLVWDAGNRLKTVTLSGT